MTRQQKYPDTSTFHFHNANPKHKLTTDCVIRAISTALEQEYTETLKELVAMSIRTGYAVSDPKCYDRYLKTKGWIKKGQPRKHNGRSYTGQEFARDCKTFDESRVIIHIGCGHIAAIMDGRIWDTWDSSTLCVGNYWVPMNIPDAVKGYLK